MFANFDLQYFPVVVVRFIGNIKNNRDFDSFTQSWLNLYSNKKNYSFIFDTTNMGIPHIKYSLKMTFFIAELRKRDHQYLQKSVIIVRNTTILRLLQFIFFIQPPVAPVHLTIDDLEKVKSNINSLENINISETIQPKKPLLPFL